MSDGITDIYRDDKKAEIVAKIRELESDPGKNKKQILKLAEECDNISRGYNTGVTCVREKVCEKWGWDSNYKFDLFIGKNKLEDIIKVINIEDKEVIIQLITNLSDSIRYLTMNDIGVAILNDCISKAHKKEGIGRKGTR